MLKIGGSEGGISDGMAEMLAAADHLVGGLVPNMPLTIKGVNPGEDVGGTPPVAAAARRDAWPKVLAFLDRT